MHRRQGSDEKGHRRIHSRNLSVHFPRPAPAGVQSPIAEDTTDDESAVKDAPVQEIEIKPKPFGAGFKFGSKPPGSLPDSAPSPPPLSGNSASSATSSRSRRGHHHKHSLSHNFFSFLEPSASQQSSLHTQPTVTPVSPWTPMSGITPSTSTFAAKQLEDPRVPRRVSSWSSTAATTLQSLLGALLWVRGQQSGSLSTTALGYWIVFDAFGLSICSGQAFKVVGSNPSVSKHNIRRPFGPARVESVLLFAQVVYLMFAAVYVCKETVEHLLLSAGGGVSEGDGHHHHRGDEEIEDGHAIEFPVFLIVLTFFSLTWTSVGFGNHAKLVSVTNTRIPISLPKIIAAVVPESSKSAYLQSSSLEHPFSEQWTSALSNPYTALPLLISLSLLIISSSLPPATQHTADLFLAAGITCLTFDLAYRACVVLGAVLLQTSPSRSKPSRSLNGSASSPSYSSPVIGDGKMERFLRVMREVEKHPQVLHLPAPHIWQLSPSSLENAPSLADASSSQLIVTLDLHVRPDLPDEDALNLTRWVWERCITALGVPGALNLARQGAEDIGAEVTVGIVRG